MNGGRVVHVVVPDGVDDPARPSGGNTYDRRVCAALAGAGWAVRSRSVPGDWPWADQAARRLLADVLDETPDDSVVVVDGLIGLAAPEALVPAARRLRTVVLVHSPLGTLTDRPDADACEAAVLASAAAVVAVSDWTRTWLVAAHRLDPAAVHVVPPGVDLAPPARASSDGGRLLCVGAVTPVKGQDLLVGALADAADLPWRCTVVGPLDRAPGFVASLREHLRAAGLDDRVDLVGPRGGRALEAAYAAADVLVLPSRVESYGMVVTEALARGLPVLASEVGGVPEALGMLADGRRPGLLSPAGDAAALAGSVRRWLTDPHLRGRLHESAAERRDGLPGWDETAQRMASVLEAVAA